MQTLSRLVARGSIAPPPLPPMFPSWGARGLVLREQSVHMIAGVAGTFKTMVLLSGLANMKVPTLVFSTDSDDATVASRLLGIATGKPTKETEDWLRTQPQRCTELLSRYDFLQWQFLPNPSLDDIWLETYAYGERYGRWPTLICIDILMDISHGEGGEWEVLRLVIKEAKVLARETRAAVLIIHHASEGMRGKPCPSRGEIMGKAAASPSLMVTLGKDEEDGLWAACVKNRHGPSDITGRTAFRMGIDPASSRVFDWQGYNPYAKAVEGGKEWWQ
jgi:hypothetical protein